MFLGPLGGGKQASTVRVQFPHHGGPAQALVPPPLGDGVLQALEVQRVREAAAVVRQRHLEPVGLLPDADLAAGLQLAPAEAAPGREALRVPPAQVPVPEPHLLHGVLDHHVRGQRLELVQVVDHPAPPAPAGVRQEAVLHLGAVQVHHLEVPHAHGPVRDLARGHELHQVPRRAPVEQRLRGVELRQTRGGGPLEHALVPVVHGARHLLARVVVHIFLVGLFLRSIPVPGSASVLQLVVVGGEYVGDADPRALVRVRALGVRGGHFCVTQMRKSVHLVPHGVTNPCNPIPRALTRPFGKTSLRPGSEFPFPVKLRTAARSYAGSRSPINKWS
ncbi:unnamed protein product [Menidia menidia]|uniref:(Atlantic silverside) hypothetical protein n=1 Tax=Menidia menidia TaxID=238744 RepID=A0A8S4AN33_9TELE|nr:unnamed protein product [Menidia menidia]